MIIKRLKVKVVAKNNNKGIKTPKIVLPKIVHQRDKMPAVKIIGLVAAVLSPILAIGFGIWFYTNHALPNVFVGNIKVGQNSWQQIKAAVSKQTDIKVTFVDDSQQKITVPIRDVGVAIDTEKTAKAAFSARRQGDFWQNIRIWQSNKISLVYTTDPGTLKAYIAKNYPAAFIDAKDAQLNFNADSKQFEIAAGQPGRGFDIKSFENELPKIMASPHDVTLKLATTPVQPLLKSEDLAVTKEDINHKLSQPIQFSMAGKQVYAASADDIASWVHFVPDFAKSKVNIEFDKAKIQQLLDQVVAPLIVVSPIERKVIVDEDTGAETVIQAGRSGWQIKDTDGVADSILAALAAGRPLDQAISVVEAPFKTVTITGKGRWIEIDLSKQTLTTYLGNQALNTYLISSGRAATPTLPGTFKVYAKYPIQTMTGTINGEYYYVPNIKWVSYFNDGRAMHGTYWHNNFGHPMSHGCINMTEDAAKVIYDFAPIGTTVVVHY